MTKNQALSVLGSMAGGVGLVSAGAAHVLWHGGRRRLSIVLLAAGVATDSLMVSSCLIPGMSLTGKVFNRGNPTGDQVALTFDDGPRPPFTEKILDVLKQESVPATFFVLGENALKFPETVRRMEREGHRVANHGMDHSILMWAGAREAQRQVMDAGEALQAAGVADPSPLFRAPHGWLSPPAYRAISSLGFTVTGWTKGVWDTANPGVEKIVSRAGEVLKPGSILLLHDGWQGGADEDRSQTAAALPSIIREARDRGLQFTTVEQMIAGQEGAV